MSRVVRRKHVIREMMDDDYELPKDQQQIVRVLNSRGNNLHEVESGEPDSETFLVSMPTKFRNTVWVKRGHYLLVEPIEEGAKVKAELVKVLTPEHIKEYTKAGVWPKRFTNKRQIEDEVISDDEDGEFIVKNRNRPTVQQYESDSDTTSSEDE